jgi:capsular exopolysaccharide synthesis family protein
VTFGGSFPAGALFLEEVRNTADERGALRSLGRRAWLIALCALLAAGSALVWSLLQAKEYSATAKLFVPSTGTKGVPSWQAAANNAELISQDSVAKAAADDVGGGVTPDQILSSVGVDSSQDTNVLSVTATASDPRRAAAIANAFVDNSGRAFKGDEVDVLTRASVPASPSSPNVARNTAFGGILGLLLGAVVALLLARFDRRLRRSDELEETVGVPVLGSVPESRALASFVDGARPGKRPPGSPPFVDTEALRMLATRLRYFGKDRDFRSIIVTSALPREGKTTIAANLAMTEADSGSRVLLVEADLRRPALASIEGLHRLPGLAELLSGQSTLDGALQQVGDPSHPELAARSLDVIVGGNAPSNPVEVLKSPNMAKLLEEVSVRYDLVVVDAPPLPLLADPIPLITLAGGVLVVAELGKVTRDDVARLLDQLRSLDAHVLGVVANRAPRGRDQRYSGYYRSDQGSLLRRFGRRRDGERNQRGSRTQRAPTVTPVAGGTKERAGGRGV